MEGQTGAGPGGPRGADRGGDRGDRGGDRGGAAARRPFFRRRKSCPFSGPNAPKIDYKDVRLLQRFVSERGKIVPSRITAVSTKRQRELAQLPLFIAGLWLGTGAAAVAGVSACAVMLAVGDLTAAILFAVLNAGPV